MQLKYGSKLLYLLLCSLLVDTAVPKPDSPIPPLPDVSAATVASDYNKLLLLHHMMSMLSFTARIVSCSAAHSADA
jgi:hypothetical protein